MAKTEKNRLVQIVFWAVIILSAGYITKCTVDNKKVAKIEANNKAEKKKMLKKYDVINIDKDGEKLSLEITLIKELSKDELKEIAYFIKGKHSTFKTIYIGCYLKDIGITETYWATAHFTPYLEVKINSFVE